MEFDIPYRLGLALHRTGHHAKAMECFESISDTTRDVTVFTHLCLCALHVGQIDRARSAFHRGQSVDPSDPDWTQLRQVFVKQRTGSDGAVALPPCLIPGKVVKRVA